METQITVQAVEYTKTGSQTLKTANGTFYIKKGDINKYSVMPNQTVTVVYEPSEYKGKTYNWVNGILGTAASTTPAPTNGKYTSEDKEAFARKDLLMCRMAALKASVEMAKTEVELAKVDPADSIDAGVTQGKYYLQFLAELTK